MTCLLVFLLSCGGAKATTLNVVSFGAAVADTYTTQRFANHHEDDPLTRAFQTHGRAVAYVSTTAGVLALSAVASRMRTSRNRIMRTLWWLPQLSVAAVNAYYASENTANFNAGVR